MSLKTILLLLALSPLTFNLKSQSNIELPVQGTYKVAVGAEEQKRWYDAIKMEGNTYCLVKEGKITNRYMVILLDNGIYRFEEFFLTNNDDPKRDRGKFSVRFEENNPNDYLITLIFPNRTEKLRLVKSDK